ncbi:Exonuclease 1 [Platanthera guangdongensis]|uniref:Exonuclease 1 n=1 Tax=Platanthera guangdongensis TaxID=2320717 RepID=A0ABR2MKC6_9ASPA
MQPIHAQDLRGKTVAVDTYSWLHKGAIYCSTQLCKGLSTSKYLNIAPEQRLVYKPSSSLSLIAYSDADYAGSLDDRQFTTGFYIYFVVHIDYCMHRVKLLQHYGVKPILVFDGGLLPMKIDQETKRARKRKENLERALEHEASGNSRAAFDCYQKAVDISPSIAFQLIQVLKQENVDYVVAPYEADAQMTFLSMHNHVDAVITEDSDLIPFGCSRIIFKMDKFGQGIEFQSSMLERNRDLDFTGFTKQMILEMCIFSGCDYLSSLPGMGLKRAHALIRKHKSYEKVNVHFTFHILSLESQYKMEIKRAFLCLKHRKVEGPAGCARAGDLKQTTILAFSNVILLGGIDIRVQSGHIRDTTMSPEMADRNKKTSGLSNTGCPQRQRQIACASNEHGRARAAIDVGDQRKPQVTDDRPTSLNSGAAFAEFQHLVVDRFDALGAQFNNVRHDLAEVNLRLEHLENARDTPTQRDESLEDDLDAPPHRGQRLRDGPPPADRHRRDIPHRAPIPPVRRNTDFALDHRQVLALDRLPDQRDEYSMPQRGPPPARYDYVHDDYPEDYPDPRRGGHHHDITRRIRLDAPSFDGRLDPKAFSDWLLDMDHYFEWYDMSDERCVRFAKMKLIGQAKGSLTVAEYMACFDELVVRSDVSEGTIATASRFKGDLRSEIRRELIPHRIETVDQIFQLALEYEQNPAPPQTTTAAPSRIPTDANDKAIATDGPRSGGIVGRRGGSTSKLNKYSNYDQESMRDIYLLVAEFAYNSSSRPNDLYSPLFRLRDLSINELFSFAFHLVSEVPSRSKKSCPIPVEAKPVGSSRRNPSPFALAVDLALLSCRSRRLVARIAHAGRHSCRLLRGMSPPFLHEAARRLFLFLFFMIMRVAANPTCCRSRLPIP